MRRLTAPARDRGIALVAVLWFTVAIAGLAAAFATLARGEALRSRNMVDAIRARTVLEAALDRAALELMTPTVEPLPRGVEFDWPFAGALVHITLTGQSGRLDLNGAGPALIMALVRELGGDKDTATRVADAVLDWRDENSLRRPHGAEDREYRSAGREAGAADAPFAHISELRELLPVDAALYHRLRDLVTVTTGRPAPEARLAAAPLERAMLGKDAEQQEEHEASLLADADSPPESTEVGPDEGSPRGAAPEAVPLNEGEPPDAGGFTDPAGVYAVRLEALLASGYRAHTDAVIWLRDGPNGRPFQVLDWDPSPWRDGETG